MKGCGCLPRYVRAARRADCRARIKNPAQNPVANAITAIAISSARVVSIRQLYHRASGLNCPSIVQELPISASFADAYDLFIDLGVLRILCLYRIVAGHRGSLSYCAVDAASYCAAGAVTRCSDSG
jgi:hypothetical protein